MANENFTPGEWKVESFYYEIGKRTVYEIVYNEDGDRVAESIDKKEDAYLMATSKKMYQKLKVILTLCEGNLLRKTRCDILGDEISELLREARGER